MAAGIDRFEEAGEVGGDRTDDHVGAGNHDLTNNHIPEFEDGMEHLPFLFIEDANGFRFFDELLQLHAGARPPRPAVKDAIEQGAEGGLS
jgi:hypothetical protein